MKESLLLRLDTMCERYEELAALMSDPAVINDQNKFREYSKEYAELEWPIDILITVVSYLQCQMLSTIVKLALIHF